MIEFQISTRHTGTKRRIKVMVYDNVQQLKRATRKRDGFYGFVQTPAWYEQMAATTNFIEISDVDVDEVADPPDDSFKPYITVRLSRDKLHQYPTEIVTHESTHAAIFLFNCDVKKTLKRVENQEILCYLVGEISRKIVNKLYEKGVL